MSSKNERFKDPYRTAIGLSQGYTVCANPVHLVYHLIPKSNVLVAVSILKVEGPRH
jgi:hypothetical protein